MPSTVIPPGHKRCKGPCGEIKPLEEFTHARKGSSRAGKQYTRSGEIKSNFNTENICYACINKRDRRTRNYSKVKIVKCKLANSTQHAKDKGYMPCTTPIHELVKSYTETCQNQNCKKFCGPSIHLDHDHKTGKFRAWLCKRCNIIIGTIDTIEKLMPYIKILGFSLEPTQCQNQNPVRIGGILEEKPENLIL